MARGAGEGISAGAMQLIRRSQTRWTRAECLAAVPHVAASKGAWWPGGILWGCLLRYVEHDQSNVLWGCLLRYVEHDQSIVLWGCLLRYVEHDQSNVVWGCLLRYVEHDQSNVL